ncbi:hypothetical protein PVAND_015617 [Polypedilum vanderplanki]|uniref:Uncharacterized protein n=1 Tax=Polypedilum vanderplanki TaxID=319348 RepID=A0A9J6BDP2_POLVA|nr:hypothetical protein PVAND_015617 [Polypedilum vanderplanki]
MKIFFITLAVLGIFVNTSNGTYRKCFGITSPAPTLAPTVAPTVAPTASPTIAPTASPTNAPTAAPTSAPTTASNILGGCAVWMRYLGDDQPAHIGLKAGISARTNTDAYVGIGLAEDITYAGRIAITPTTLNGITYPPSAFLPYGGIEFKAEMTEFLIPPQGCNCSFWPASNGMTRPGLVYAGTEANFKIVVGRKTFADGRISVSSVYTDPGNLAMYNKQNYIDGNGMNVIEAPTEVLVCESNSPTTGPPIINFPTEACGVWSSYGMVNSAATNGFAVGKSIMNNTAYIGRGLYAAGTEYHEPGRYQLEPPTGTYLIYEPNKLAAANNQWLIVPQNCTCRFMAPGAAKARKGLIFVGDDEYAFMWGLHKFSTGQVAITAVRYADLFEYYVNLDGISLGSGFATQVLVCENVPPPPQGCALWAAYLDDNAPAINGFYAGNSTINNSPVYVGWGDYGDLKLPARIQITTTSTGTLPRTPGGYVSAGAEVQVTYPEYLVVPNSCSCSWINPSLASNHPGLILTSDINFQYAVGRKTFPDGTISITKVVTNPSYTNYMKQTYNNAAGVQIVDEPATELLVCETTASTATAPVFTFANEACGVWSTDNMVTSAQSNGFSVGPSIFPNITNYVGRGQWTTAEIRIGRYQDENLTGAYTSSAGEKIMQYSQWLIVPEGCNCYWLSANQALVRRGLITSSDDTYNFAVSYKNYTTAFSISRVILSSFVEFYTTSNNMDGSDVMSNTGPLLVCENIPQPPKYPCALWAAYLNDNSPTVNGFNGGISAYYTAANSTAWIARGDYGNIMIPGRVQITGSTGSIYVTVGVELTPNLGGGEYLVVRDGCQCSWLPPYLASNHPGLVKTSDLTFDYAISRINSTDGRVSIGKTTTPNYNTIYTSPSGVQNVLTYPKPMVDVLVCESNADMSTKPMISFVNDACGLWARYNYNDWPARHGFSFGLDRFNNTGYIGRAFNGGYYFIGRLSLVGNSGVYVSNGNEPLGTNAEYLVVPDRCICQWVPYSTAVFNRIGLVRSFDFNYKFAVGRVSLGNNQYALSSVKSNGEQWFVNAAGIFTINLSPTELLVCELP